MNPRLLLGLLVLLALPPRLAAVYFNAWPHGDVLLDAAVTDALVQRGELKVPLVDIRFYPTERFGFGYPPDQHPPLWSLLGTAGRLVWLDSYQALKLASLVVGLLVLPAVYLCGRDLFGGGPALFAVALCALSYLMIDFSGNGSLWGLLALLYVLFAWRAGAYSLSNPANGALVGLFLGAAYLTNYPGIVLPVCFLLLFLLRGFQSVFFLRSWQLPLPIEESWGDGRHSSSRFSPRGRGTGPFGVWFLPASIGLLLVLPWLAFSLLTFGSPIWSQPLERQLGGGDKKVEVVVQPGGVVKRAVSGPDPAGERLSSTVQTLYGNVGFLARQTFVLMPFWGGFALAGVIALVLAAVRGGAVAELPLLLVILAHATLIIFWPTTKFRYLVPLFPLAALVGSWFLWQLKPVELRNLIAGIVLGLACFTSAWTYASIPSHTYYYDGGIVTDNFGGQGEIAYVEQLRHLELAANAIRAAGAGTVMGPHALYTLARQPLVINSADYSREVVERLVRRYNVRYIVAEPAQMGFYAAFIGGEVLWQDSHFGVFQVRS